MEEASNTNQVCWEIQSVNFTQHEKSNQNVRFEPIQFALPSADLPSKVARKNSSDVLKTLFTPDVFVPEKGGAEAELVEDDKKMSSSPISVLCMDFEKCSWIKYIQDMYGEPLLNLYFAERRLGVNISTIFFAVHNTKVNVTVVYEESAPGTIEAYMKTHPDYRPSAIVPLCSTCCDQDDKSPTIQSNQSRDLRRVYEKFNTKITRGNLKCMCNIISN